MRTIFIKNAIGLLEYILEDLPGISAQQRKAVLVKMQKALDLQYAYDQGRNGNFLFEAQDNDEENAYNQGLNSCNNMDK